MSHTLENLPCLTAGERKELLERRRHRCERCCRLDGLCYKVGDRWVTNRLHIVFIDRNTENHADRNLLVLCTECYAEYMKNLLIQTCTPEKPVNAVQLSLF